MKISKLLAGITAAVSAVAILTASVSAYDFGNKDLGKNWSINATVPASEFANLTKDSYVTITFEADKEELAEDQQYWSIKPMDSSWTFIDPNGEGGPELAEGKDAYPVDKEDTSITFKVPTDFVESIKTGGMVIIGHRITLKTLTVSDEAPATEAPATEAPATEAPADQTEAENNNTENNSNTEPDKGMPNTGVESVAVLAGVGILAAAAVLFTKKRK